MERRIPGLSRSRQFVASDAETPPDSWPSRRASGSSPNKPERADDGGRAVGPGLRFGDWLDYLEFVPLPVLDTRNVYGASKYVRSPVGRLEIATTIGRDLPPTRAQRVSRPFTDSAESVV
jgi:hypothetical protein